MKRVCSIFLMLYSFSILCGCALSIHTFISSPGEYDTAWSFSGYDRTHTWLSMRGYCEPFEPTPLFPSSVSELTVNKFISVSNSPLPFVEQHQFYLSVTYNEQDFLEEVARIGQIATIEESEYFDLPAAIAVFNLESCYEYALFDKDDLTVHYVYLESASKKHLSVDEEYLPKGYSEKCYLEDAEVINVYLSTDTDEEIEVYRYCRMT